MNKFKIISFLILTSFSSFSFAGAAEDRTQSIIDQALSTKNYSSAQGHNYTVGNVKAANDIVSADITQRVVVGGSSASVNQRVTLPANDAFYNNTGKYAKSILKGGVYSAAFGLAVGGILDGVGWVMDQGGNITKPDISNTPYFSIPDIPPYVQYFYSWTTYQAPYYRSPSVWGVSTFTCSSNNCNGKNSQGQTVYFTRYPNSKYSSSAEPASLPVSDSEVSDVFSNWFKNNPSSVTDPVITYIYSPKTPTGAPATTPQNNPSFGQQEITDEMMDNYLANRNAELYANDVAANQAAIRDSAQVETEAKPDVTKTETKPNPDGSKTETKTETKINPDTGEVETTVTETVINPDGSRGESKETVKKTETKPNPETSKLPAACEYFSVLCDWIGWTKENPDMPDEQPLQLQELDIGSLDTSTFQATAGCPADIQVPVSFGGASKSIAISYEPICALAQKWSFIAPLIGFISGAMILIGVGRKGEDGDS